MIIDCISDLHGYFPELEGGDLLIIAGDLTARDEPEEYFKFEDWFESQKYRKKIVIAGNHDNFLEKYGHNLFRSDDFGEQYLQDSGVEFDGLKIWGSPWTITFPGMNPHCKAFTVDTEQELEQKWRTIPVDIDILITHSPPYGILDAVMREINEESVSWDQFEHIGSHSLLYYSRMQQPRLHVFGHIHEAYGKEMDETITSYVNASYVNEYYKPVNKPIRIIL